MGTLTEEILSRKVGRRVQAGEIVVVDLDLVMSHDTTTPLAMEAFYGLTRPERATTGEGQAAGRSGVFDRSRVVIAFDHIVPAATIQAASTSASATARSASLRAPSMCRHGGPSVAAT